MASKQVRLTFDGDEVKRPLIYEMGHEFGIVTNIRMADVDKDPLPIIKKSVSISKRYKNVKILWASTREAYNYLQAKQCGCSIITMPPAIIKKISKFGKTYNQLTLDTVRKFLEDSRESRFKI